MGSAVQIVAAILAVAFLAFLAYAALVEDRHHTPLRRRVAARPDEPDRAPDEPAPGGDARAGGPQFRRQALAAAEDPILTPSPEEKNRP